MKKPTLLLVLAMIVAGGIFAQEKSASAKSNWISGEVSLLGGGVRYERMLTEKLSIGANAYWNTFFLFWNELEAGASVRFYPSGKTFLVGLGLGFHTHTGTFQYEYSGGSYTWFGTITGVAITPEVGWKIDVGKVGGFFLSPGIKAPITLGVLEEYLGVTGGFRVGFGVVPYFGLGFAF